MDREYLIIGGGVAGTSAASAIREQDANGRITILSEEPYPLYSRLRLPEFIAGRLDSARLLLKQESWYQEQRVRLRLQERAVAVDGGRRTVRTDAGRQYSYDRLLLATGGVSFLPSIPGIGRAGVFSLRTITDAIGIKEFAAVPRRVAMIGGGLLGLETANALRLAGCEVTVVEFAARLLPRQTDGICSAMLQKRLEAMGLSFVLGASVKEIVGAERVNALRLADGRSLPCEMVIVAAGMRGSVELARAMGLAVQRGVLVDDRMATSQPQVFAAGDLVEHRGAVYGIWPAAQHQGVVAGVNMAGGEQRFTGMVPSNLLKVAGIDLFAVGDIDAEGRFPSVVLAESERFIYRKLVLDAEKRLIGAILLGDLSHRRLVSDAIGAARPLGPGVVAGLREGRLELLAGV